MTESKAVGVAGGRSLSRVVSLSYTVDKFLHCLEGGTVILQAPYYVCVDLSEW